MDVASSASEGIALTDAPRSSEETLRGGVQIAASQSESNGCVCEVLTAMTVKLSATFAAEQEVGAHAESDVVAAARSTLSAMITRTLGASARRMS